MIIVPIFPIFPIFLSQILTSQYYSKNALFCLGVGGRGRMKVMNIFSTSNFFLVFFECQFCFFNFPFFSSVFSSFSSFSHQPRQPLPKQHHCTRQSCYRQHACLNPGHQSIRELLLWHTIYGKEVYQVQSSNICQIITWTDDYKS